MLWVPGNRDGNPGVVKPLDDVLESAICSGLCTFKGDPFIFGVTPLSTVPRSLPALSELGTCLVSFDGKPLGRSTTGGVAAYFQFDASHWYELAQRYEVQKPGRESKDPNNTEGKLSQPLSLSAYSLSRLPNDPGRNMEPCLGLTIFRGKPTQQKREATHQWCR